MKRFFSLLVLFVVFLGATLTLDQWYPWLFEQLSDSKTSTALGAFGTLLDIVFKFVTAILGIAAFLGWRRPQAPGPAQPVNPETAAR